MLSKSLAAAALLLSIAAAAPAPQAATTTTTACTASATFVTAGFSITNFVPVLPSATASVVRPDSSWAAQHQIHEVQFGNTPGYPDYKCQYNCAGSTAACEAYYITERVSQIRSWPSLRPFLADMCLM